MYKMYLAAQEKEANWSVDLMQKHQEEMVGVLLKYFSENYTYNTEND